MPEQAQEGPKIRETAGRQSLTNWLRENGVSKHAFSKMVRVSQQAVTGWLRGLTSPDDHRRKLIEVVTAIEPSSWNVAEDVEKRAAELAEVRPFSRGAA
jgi:predicted transcriptional regulator